jgi:hypothetical protein
MKRGRPTGRKLDNSITFRLDDAGMETLARLADEEQRPVSMMARILLSEAMAARGRKESPVSRRKGKSS